MSEVDPRAEMCNPLMVPDLFYIILECFRPALDPMARQALASLAQTCRAFSEPSLNCLWRKLRSLEPLIRCYTTVDDMQNAIPPTSSQIAIINRYSHRVREVSISESTSVRFLQCTSMRPSCLLPNLMVLHWDSFGLPPHIPIILIQRLLSPTLVSLTATLAEADGAILLSFFDNYPQLCPNLKSVEFSFLAGHSATIIQALSRAICSQNTLEHVILNAPVDDKALEHLSMLPSLKVLTVTLSERSRPRTRSILPTDPLFRNVEVLGFDTSDLDLVTNLLRPRDQRFHTFRLYHHKRLTSMTAATFLDVLASRSRTQPLQEFTFSSGDVSHPVPVDQMASEAPRYRLSYETLQPLMVFGSLRSLDIEWSEQVSLDDDEVAKLARSWPLLQVFKLYCGRGGYPPFSTKYPTLLGLLSLVTCCPKLHTVSLPLDATQVPEVKEAKPCKTNFACLIVPESPIDQALPVAEFLFEYVPCVTAVDARFLMPPGTNFQQISAYEQGWQEVEELLEEFNDLLSDPVTESCSIEDAFEGILV